MTTYKYTVSNCHRTDTDIVTEVAAKWEAVKTDDGKEYKSDYTEIVVLDPPGSSPIAWSSLDADTLNAWYANKIKEKLTVYNQANPKGTPDKNTVEENIKGALDRQIEQQIYQEASEKKSKISSGLPY
jgi:hypothetical protein